MKTITVIEKHRQRAKKRGWMQSQRCYYNGSFMYGIYKGSTSMVVLEPIFKASFKTTKNYEND